MPEIFIGSCLYDAFIKTCVNALPHKAFGLVGGADICHPNTIYPCTTNLRNEPEWRPIFESFGEFYKDPDLGFVIAHPEVRAVLEAMDSYNENLVGVFHSHRYLRAEPSEIDLYLSSNPDWLSYIISVADPLAPEMGVFRLNGRGYERIQIVRV